MAKAILNGNNPYLPIPELTRLFLSGPDFEGVAAYTELSHPTPHTPIAGLLSLPLGFLSYKTAVVVWFVIELACLLIIARLILRWWNPSAKTTSIILLFFIALGWLPIIEDLWFGQFSIFLLLLLLGAWLALQKKCDVLAGTLLGGMITLKLIAWPIVIYLALRRKWRSTFAAITIIIFANLLAIFFVGKSQILDYYFRIGPLVASLYRSMDANISTWTLGRRFFQGFGQDLFILPLLSSPSLTVGATYLIPPTVLIIGLWLAYRAKTFDTGFSIMIGTSILITPIVWTHYLTLIIIPVMILARRLVLLNFPALLSYVTFCLLLFLSINNLGYVQLALLLATRTPQTPLPNISFAAGLLTMIPLAAIIGILWLVWYGDERLSEDMYRRLDNKAS